MLPTASSHLLLLVIPAWGRARPLCVLAARLVSEHDNIVITLLVAPNVLEKTSSEVSRQFQNQPSKRASSRIRIVSLFKSKGSQLFDMIKPLADSYPIAYKTLVQEKQITCAMTGTIFDAVPAPVVAIMDFFAISQLRDTRAISGSSVPIIAWLPSGATHTLRVFGPGSMGGLGDLGARIDIEARHVNKTAEEVGNEVLKRTTGAIINIPGLPGMYDYEFFPQNLHFETPTTPLLRAGYAFVRECDAGIIGSAEAYEKVPLAALKSWLSELQKPLYVLGPLLPSAYGSSEAPVGRGDIEISIFLETMLARHGSRSVLFISFGTIFWPAHPEYIDEVVNALLEKRFPFILSYASPFAKVSEELTEKIRSSNLGMLTTWSPQQLILNHPATGWFLTHGGHGGITESLGSGIPLICWPFQADQPAAALHVTESLGVAFELIQVRTGLGLKPLYRNGQTPQGTREAVGTEIREVIDACRGQKGAEMRQKAERMKVDFVKAWQKGGSSKREMEMFLDKYILNTGTTS